ncbi:hypothetical protein CLV48_11573 [Cecembia rubra]|uniref:Uncharacterized protein n=1 Tax=Cecembia rubra TaxID=1485585 RepID=A0A2P8DTI7_9BACT|nr:hypothetical protein CLV48_11573 [Cecembia rubra]
MNNLSAEADPISINIRMVKNRISNDYRYYWGYTYNIFYRFISIAFFTNSTAELTPNF